MYFLTYVLYCMGDYVPALTSEFLVRALPITGFLGESYTKTALSINLAKTGKRLAYP